VQSHGLPKIIGVLTHLDLISKASILRATKKAIKKRFWAEIYQGSKLFYLSGVLNGRYPDNEILNLSRFISVLKFRPLLFRNTHPYVLADRVEDRTSRELIRISKGKCDRNIALYGYVRGTNFRQNSKVHIPGVGDLVVQGITSLGDPCPLPDPDSEKRRKLSEKRKLLMHATRTRCGSMSQGTSYGEMILVCAHAIWSGSAIQTPSTVPRGEGERMVTDLQDIDNTLDDAIAHSHIKLLNSSSTHLILGHGSSRHSTFSNETDPEKGIPDDQTEGDWEGEIGDEEEDSGDDETDDLEEEGIQRVPSSVNSEGSALTRSTQCYPLCSISHLPVILLS
jgi:ribosome biogenesis protein BMS1